MPLELVLALGFFALILGYVIGNFLPVLKDNPLFKKTPTPADDPAPSLTPKVDPAPDALPPAAPIPGMLEIARMLRKGGSNQLVAQIDSKLLFQGDDLTSDQHALLSLLLLDLSDWVGIQSRLDSTAARSEKPSPESEKSAPGFSPVDMFKKALQADVFLPSAEISLADQIDPILQDLLGSSPLSEKGIRLMDIEGRGMVVAIGLHMYPSVEEVPDAEVKAIIKKAVSIWESRLEGKE